MALLINFFSHRFSFYFHPSLQLDIYYPIFMTIKFLFYFGWLRVAETLYNPFGEDDDDFEINDLLDRHFRVALAMVDDTEDPPVLQRDVFWDVQEAALVSTIINWPKQTLNSLDCRTTLRPPCLALTMSCNRLQLSPSNKSPTSLYSPSSSISPHTDSCCTLYHLITLHTPFGILFVNICTPQQTLASYTSVASARVTSLHCTFQSFCTDDTCYMHFWFVIQTWNIWKVRMGCYWVDLNWSAPKMTNYRKIMLRQVNVLVSANMVLGIHAKNVWCYGEGYFGQKNLQKKCVNRDKM